LKQIETLTRIQKNRGGQSINAASLFQLLNGLTKTKAKAMSDYNAQIGKQAGLLMAESEKNRKEIELKETHPKLASEISAQIPTYLNQINRGTSIEDKIARAKTAWIQGLRSHLGRLKSPTRATRKAVAAAVAIAAKNAEGSSPYHKVGYEAIRAEEFGGVDPEEWMAREYPVLDSNQARAQASKTIPAIANIDNDLKSARLLLNQEFGWGLAEGEQPSAEMVEAAKSGQGDEIDLLIKGLTKQYLAGGGQSYGGGDGFGPGRGARINQAQMILGMGLAAPPLIGAQAFGAGPRLTKLALKAQREMIALRRERMAFESKFGYAPGSQRREATSVLEPGIVGEADQQDEARELTSGPGGGNLLDFMRDHLAQSKALMGSAEPEVQKSGAQLAKDIFEMIGSLPESAQKSLARGMGYKDVDEFVAEVSSGFYEEPAGAVDGMLTRLETATGDTHLRRFGEIAPIYEEMLTDLANSDDKSRLLNVLAIEKFVAQLPAELRGEIGEQILDATGQFRAVDRKDPEAVRDGLSLLLSSLESTRAELSELDPGLTDAQHDLAIEQRRESEAQLAELESAFERSGSALFAAEGAESRAQARFDALTAEEPGARRDARRGDEAVENIRRLETDLNETQERLDRIADAKKNRGKVADFITYAEDVLSAARERYAWSLNDQLASPEKQAALSREQKIAADKNIGFELADLEEAFDKDSVDLSKLTPHFREWARKYPDINAALGQIEKANNEIAEINESMEAIGKEEDLITRETTLKNLLAGAKKSAPPIDEVAGDIPFEERLRIAKAALEDAKGQVKRHSEEVVEHETAFATATTSAAKDAADESADQVLLEGMADFLNTPVSSSIIAPPLPAPSPTEATTSTGAGAPAGGSARTSARTKEEISKNITPALAESIRETASNLNIPSKWLTTLIAAETGGSFKADQMNNLGSRAVGLIQFMPNTAARLLNDVGLEQFAPSGTAKKPVWSSKQRKEATATFAHMKAKDQMVFVERYLEPFKDRIKTQDDLAMAVFYPAAMGEGRDYDIEAQYRLKGPKSLAKYQQGNKGIITAGDYLKGIDRYSNMIPSLEEWEEDEPLVRDNPSSGESIYDVADSYRMQHDKPKESIDKNTPPVNSGATEAATHV